MKKILLSGALALSTLGAFAQEVTDPFVTYHNEFGLDATGFLRQFFNVDNNLNGSNYYPTYYLTYRRKFAKGNIRFAFGGSYANTDQPSPYPNDKNKYGSTAYGLDLRIGWEFKTEISKRWQAFYGLDFRPSFFSQKNDAPYFNGGYANGMESKGQNYGFAPVLGLRFKLTNRLSILTEASLSMNFQKVTNRQYFISPNNQEPVPPEQKTEQTRMYTSFNQPLAVFITFDI